MYKHSMHTTKIFTMGIVVIQTVGAVCQLAGGLLIVYHLHLLEPRADYIEGDSLHSKHTIYRQNIRIRK